MGLVNEKQKEKPTGDEVQTWKDNHVLMENKFPQVNKIDLTGLDQKQTQKALADSHNTLIDYLQKLGLMMASTQECLLTVGADVEQIKMEIPAVQWHLESSLNTGVDEIGKYVESLGKSFVDGLSEVMDPMHQEFADRLRKINLTLMFMNELLKRIDWEGLQKASNIPTETAKAENMRRVQKKAIESKKAKVTTAIQAAQKKYPELAESALAIAAIAKISPRTVKKYYKEGLV